MQIIYCVEDDENIRELVIYALKNSGFEAKGFESGAYLQKELERALPSLILLDIMLPDEDGLMILKRLKSAPDTAHIPIILLTAKASEFDKVKGLDIGADDYIAKPFGIMELLSRVRAILRRAAPVVSNQILTYARISLDAAKHKVFADGQEIILTYKEFALIQYLMHNQGIVLTRDTIMNTIWGFDFAGESRTVDMHIKTLRKKLGNVGSCIHTVRGVGYKMEE